MSTNGSSAHNPELDEVKRDLVTLQNDLSRLVQSLVGDKQQSLADMARTGKRAIEKTEAGIRHRPFVAMMIAFVIGLLFGRVVVKGS